MLSRLALLAGLAFGTCLASGDAEAQLNCRITAMPLAFGVYAPGDPAPLDTSGQLQISCRGNGRDGIFQIGISTGSSGDYAAREMRSGAFVMLYNLFIDAARTLVWGDGTGGTATHNASMPRNGRVDFSFPLYGRVPPRQSVGSGSYLDDVIITVSF